MRISDWSSDVCSSDLHDRIFAAVAVRVITAATANLIEPFVLIQGDSVRVAGPYLQKHAAGVMPACNVEHSAQQSPTEATSLDLRRAAQVTQMPRSEERRVGTTWVSTVRYGWSQN